MEYRVFSGYMFYEDGTVRNPLGIKLSKRVHQGRYDIKIFINGKRRNILFARLYYWLFVEQFDINDRNLCVISLDGNHLNTIPSNLKLVERKSMLQGEGHKKTKISDQQIEEMKISYNEGKTLKEIGKNIM